MVAQKRQMDDTVMMDPQCKYDNGTGTAVGTAEWADKHLISTSTINATRAHARQIAKGDAADAYRWIVLPQIQHGLELIYHDAGRTVDMMVGRSTHDGSGHRRREQCGTGAGGRRQSGQQRHGYGYGCGTWPNA